MSVDNKDGKQTAMFQRPGTAGSKLFIPTDAGGNSLAESISYTFRSLFFTDTYEDYLYNKSANPYYADIHAYNDYQLLVSGVPYIVRFPGERYYEFDLSSSFYNSLFKTNEAEQTVTFNAYGPDNENNTSLGTVNIPATCQMSTSARGGFSYMGTFSARKVAEGSIYGMNDKGTAFDDASTLSTVMPFRTYMTPNTSGAKTRYTPNSAIYISELTGIDRIIPEIDPEEENSQATDEYIKVRPISDQRVSIESTYATTLKVFATTGQLYKVLYIQPGTAIYSGFQPGIYIFGGTKVLIKK